MSYALTVKSQVTVPKVIRQHLHVKPGQSVDYEPLPDGSVRMFAVREPVTENPFAKFIGTGVSGGEEGALLGPSIMPGGSPAAWPAVKDIFQAISAKVENGEACCYYFS